MVIFLLEYIQKSIDESFAIKIVIQKLLSAKQWFFDVLPRSCAPQAPDNGIGVGRRARRANAAYSGPKGPEEVQRNPPSTLKARVG